MLPTTDFNDDFFDGFGGCSTEAWHVSVLGKEDGKITVADGHLLGMKGGGVEGEVAFFAVGFRFGKFLYREASYAFLAFQGVLYVDVLTVCFVAVLVLRLGLVLGDDGFDAWIELIDAILYVRLGIAKKLQSDTNVFGNGGVCFEVVDMVVNHGYITITKTYWGALSLTFNPNDNPNLNSLVAALLRRDSVPGWG